MKESTEKKLSKILKNYGKALDEKKLKDVEKQMNVNAAEMQLPPMPDYIADVDAFFEQLNSGSPLPRRRRIIALPQEEASNCVLIAARNGSKLKLETIQQIIKLSEEAEQKKREK